MRFMSYFRHLAATLPALAALTPVLPVLIPASATAQENRLGRLFHTQEERAKLDQKRGVVVTPVQTGPQTTMVNGIITRSGQAPILFIDGKETRGPATQASAQQQLNQGVPLKGERGQTIAAKPGQIVDLASGRVLETYQLLPGVMDVSPKEEKGSSASASPSTVKPTNPDSSASTPPPVRPEQR